jgi:hypothetical protein
MLPGSADRSSPDPRAEQPGLGPQTFQAGIEQRIRLLLRTARHPTVVHLFE